MAYPSKDPLHTYVNQDLLDNESLAHNYVYCSRGTVSFSSVCIYGGGDRRAQIEAVSKGVEIIIGRFCSVIDGKGDRIGMWTVLWIMGTSGYVRKTHF